MIDSLHAYVQEHIAPITGVWRLDSERSLVESDWGGGWPIKTRKSWTCERCGAAMPKGSFAIRQRAGGRLVRRICEPCREAVRS